MSPMGLVLLFLEDRNKGPRVSVLPFKGQQANTEEASVYARAARRRSRAAARNLKRHRFEA